MPLTELEQVNAIVGLGMRIDGWPSTFADLGYVLDRIELKIQDRRSEATRLQHLHQSRHSVC
jgi:hypothetical protein